MNTSEWLSLLNGDQWLVDFLFQLPSTVEHRGLFWESWRADAQDQWSLLLRLGSYLRILQQGRLATSSKAPWLAQWNLLPSPCSHCSLHKQANKSREGFLKEGITTLFGKTSKPWKWWKAPPAQELSCLSYNSGCFYTKKGRRKVKRFLVPISLQKACVYFFLPAVIHRWAWSGSFLWAKQRHLSLMLITWKAGFPEMGHYI